MDGMPMRSPITLPRRGPCAVRSSQASTGSAAPQPTGVVTPKTSSAAHQLRSLPRAVLPSCLATSVRR